MKKEETCSNDEKSSYDFKLVELTITRKELQVINNYNDMIWT